MGLHDDIFCPRIITRRCGCITLIEILIKYISQVIEKHSLKYTVRRYRKKPIAYEKRLLKINKTQYIALFVVNGSIKKLFSIDCVNVHFSQSIINYLFSIDLKVWGYPTLLIS